MNTMETINIPLNKLSISEHNVRKTDIDRNLDELKASIAKHGVLIPIKVIEKKNKKGHYEIAAGQRRHRACKALVKDKVLKAASLIPANLIAVEDAKEISTIENVIRENMHPADQFVAFKSLIDEGHSIKDIADSFGVSEVTVRQRLKLAKVSPVIFEDFKQGKIKLQSLSSFTVSNDHEKQESVYEAFKDTWQMNNPSEIKRALKENALKSDDKMVCLVGLDAYIKAGGQLTRDLFGEEVFFESPVLVEKLFQEKIEQIKENYIAQGWSWAEIDAENYYPDSYSYDFQEPVIKKLSSAEDKKLDQLKSEFDELDYEAGSLDKRIEFSKAIRELEDKQETFTAEQKKLGGVLLCFDWQDNLVVNRGLIKSEQQSSDEDGETDQDDEIEDVPPQDEKKQKKNFSDKLTRNLSSRRTEVLQYEITQNPDYALDLLIANFVARFGSPIELTTQYITLHNDHEEKPEVEGKMEELSSKLTNRFDGIDFDEALIIVQSLDHKTKMEILALKVGQRFNTVVLEDGRKKPVVPKIIKELDVNILDNWKPTAENCFKHLSKDKLVETICLQRTDLKLVELMKQNKGELAKLAEKECPDYIPECMVE